MLQYLRQWPKSFTYVNLLLCKKKGKSKHQGLYQTEIFLHSKENNHQGENAIHRKEENIGTPYAIRSYSLKHIRISYYKHIYPNKIFKKMANIFPKRIHKRLMDIGKILSLLSIIRELKIKTTIWHHSYMSG